MTAMRRAGASFTTLVGFGVLLEVGAVMGLCQGVRSVASCYWQWFPGVSGHEPVPAACMEPLVGVGFHLFMPVALLGALVGATVVRAGWTASRVVGDTRRFWSDMGPAISSPTALVAAARAGGGVAVQLRRDDRCYACCVGMLRPKVVVSSALVALVSGEELVAVLAHEHRHQRRYAPLRAMVARTVAAGLFWVPVLSALRETHLVDEEVIADAEARAVAGRQPLIGALVKLADTSAALSGSAIGGADALSARIDALRDDYRPSLRVTRTRLAVSVVSLLVVSAVLWWMPMAGSDLRPSSPGIAVPVPANSSIARPEPALSDQHPPAARAFAAPSTP